MEPNLDPPEKRPAFVPYGTAGPVGPHLEAVRQWLADFVLQPHPLLLRDGPVCPFVGPAIRQGTLLLSERWLGRPVTEQLATTELLDCVRSFQELAWAGPNRRLHATIVLFPELTDPESALLHHAHNAMKEDLLRQDVMMSPFHPECADHAARNTAFRTFRSPVPMVAIRRLAFHDIIFLYQEKDRFLHYARRFGERYRQPAALDPFLVERYRWAVARHGDPGRAAKD